MKRQRNTTQMKEQTRNIEVQINEEEIGTLPEKEFRIMIVKMIKNLAFSPFCFQGFFYHLYYHYSEFFSR